MHITQEYLKSILHYDLDTGVFTWKKKVSKKTVVGSHAGYFAGGYHRIGILGTKIMAHRLAFLYVEGIAPKNIIDHIDGDTTNNKFINLRHATPLQSVYNRGAMKNNSCGFKGVYFQKKINKYGSRCSVGGKVKFLGYFDTAHEAGLAYINTAKAEHGEYYRDVI